MMCGRCAESATASGTRHNVVGGVVDYMPFMLLWPHQDVALYAVQRLSDRWLVRALMPVDPCPIVRAAAVIEDQTIGFSTSNNNKQTAHS
jgi:hypothetical protein